MCSKKTKSLHVDGDVEQGQFDNLYVDDGSFSRLVHGSCVSKCLCTLPAVSAMSIDEYNYLDFLIMTSNNPM